jgi:hypothetical protein
MGYGKNTQGGVVVNGVPEAEFTAYKAETTYYRFDQYDIDITGVTDVTTVIQNYFNYCAVNKVEAHLRKGTYLIEGTVTLPKNLFSKGYGQSGKTFFGTTATLINHTTNVDLFAVDQTTVNQAIVMTDIGINNSGTGKSLPLDNIGQCTFERIALIGNDVAEGMELAGDCYNNTFRDILIHRNKRGLIFTQEGAERANGNTFDRVILLTNEVGFDASLGRSEHNTFNSMNIEACTVNDFKFNGNFTGNEFNGIRIESSSVNPIITGICNGNRFNGFLAGNVNKKLYVPLTASSFPITTSPTFDFIYTPTFMGDDDSQYVEEKNGLYRSPINYFRNSRNPLASADWSKLAGVTATNIGADGEGYGQITLTSATPATDYVQITTRLNRVDAVAVLLMLIKADVACDVSVIGYTNHPTNLTVTNTLKVGTSYGIKRAVCVPQEGYFCNKFLIYMPAGRTLTLKMPSVQYGTHNFIDGILDERTLSCDRNGTTANRPSLGTPHASYNYYDTTLGVPIYWTGTQWKRYDTNAVV